MQKHGRSHDILRALQFGKAGHWCEKVCHSEALPSHEAVSVAEEILADLLKGREDVYAYELGGNRAIVN
jgi:hypothetical protein